MFLFPLHITVTSKAMTSEVTPTANGHFSPTAEPSFRRRLMT